MVLGTDLVNTQCILLLAYRLNSKLKLMMQRQYLSLFILTSIKRSQCVSDPVWRPPGSQRLEDWLLCTLYQAMQEGKVGRQL